MNAAGNPALTALGIGVVLILTAVRMSR